MDHAARIDKPTSLDCLGFGHSISAKLLDEKIRNADRCTSCAHKQNPLIAHLGGVHSARTKETCDCDRCCSLNIVIEAADFVSVSFEKWNCILVGEIFELNAATREHFLDCRNELVDEREIFIATDARHAESRIKRIIAESFVVRAHVKHDRQSNLRRHSSACGIERKFANWNAHSAHTLIAKAQNSFPVSDHNESHIFHRPIAKDLRKFSAAIHREIHALRSAHNVAKLLTRLANCGRINDRHVTLKITAQQGIKKPFLTVLKRGQKLIFAKIR